VSPQIHRSGSELPSVCPACKAFLEARATSAELIALAQCPRCGEVFGRHSISWLPSDADTALLFDEAVERLRAQGYTFDEASDVLRKYFSRFTDVVYCEEKGVPVQDADSFHHDGPWGVALRAHYCIRLGLPPDYGSFVEWRNKVQPHGKWPTVDGAA
jgi:predicted RNA-binding Zn-ribbon protein involved in translation (DUF1610 family)